MPIKDISPSANSNKIRPKILNVTKSKNGAIGDSPVWTNPSSSVIKKIVVTIPYEILCAMNNIEKMLKNGRNEFGMYLQGEYSSGVLSVSSDFYIPKQKVTAGSIAFDASDGTTGEWNGVIHRHPMGMKTFSTTDDASINQNHMFSLLYTDKNIVTGVINITPEDGYGKFQIPLDINIMFPSIQMNIKEIVESKIEETIAPAIKHSSTVPQINRGKSKFKDLSPNYPIGMDFGLDADGDDDDLDELLKDFVNSPYYEQDMMG